MDEDPEHSSTSVLHADKVVIIGGAMTQSVTHNYVRLRNSSLRDEPDDEFVQLKSLVSYEAFYDSYKYGQFLRGLTPLEHGVVQNVMAWSTQAITNRESRVLHVDLPNSQTAVAQHVAELLELENTLLGAFFFRGQNHFIEAEHIFVATLAYQLSISMPKTKQLILQAVRADPFIFTRDLRKQLQRLIIEPMSFALSRDKLNINSGIFVICMSPGSPYPNQVQRIVQAIEDTFTERDEPCYARFVILHFQEGTVLPAHFHRYIREHLVPPVLYDTLYFTGLLDSFCQTLMRKVIICRTLTEKPEKPMNTEHAKNSENTEVTDSCDSESHQRITVSLFSVMNSGYKLNMYF